ncbi:MAG: hypothetical protein K5669_11040 [Lachnospiraceae bacterium]|nr:hypothetical protein [Lachnospiraceae bacterium]
MRSKLEQAEAFTDWITEIVIPSIHHNGGYIMGQENLSPVLSDRRKDFVSHPQFKTFGFRLLRGENLAV